MNRRLRIPAWQAPQPAPAVALADDPSPRLEAMYRRIWAQEMRDMPFVNPALEVEALGFQRWRGDWLGAVITPWFLNLFVLPGGGELWQDRPAGERVRLAFPVGELDFIADNDAAPAAEVASHLYCPLFAPVDRFATQAAARAAAGEALATILRPAPDAVDDPPATAGVAAVPIPPGVASVPAAPPPHADGTRRAFFRRLAGR